MGRFAQLPADRAALWPNLSVDEAGDLLWTLNAYAVPDLLVVQRGWPPNATATGAPTSSPGRSCPTTNPNSTQTARSNTRDHADRRRCGGRRSVSSRRCCQDTR